MDINKKFVRQESYSFWHYHMHCRTIPLEIKKQKRTFFTFYKFFLLCIGGFSVVLLSVIFYFTGLVHPQERNLYQGILGAVFVILYAFGGLFLVFFLLPVFARFCFDINLIDENELRILQKRHIPDSFFVEDNLDNETNTNL